MQKDKALHLMKSMKDMIAKYGAGVPQSEKDFLDGIIQKLETGAKLEPKEQQFVEKNMKSVYE